MVSIPVFTVLLLDLHLSLVDSVLDVVVPLVDVDHLLHLIYVSLFSVNQPFLAGIDAAVVPLDHMHMGTETLIMFIYEDFVLNVFAQRFELFFLLQS